MTNGRPAHVARSFGFDLAHAVWDDSPDPGRQGQPRLFELSLAAEVQGTW